jgi:hypothetical protein
LPPRGAPGRGRIPLHTAISRKMGTKFFIVGPISVDKRLAICHPLAKAKQGKKSMNSWDCDRKLIHRGK